MVFNSIIENSAGYIDSTAIAKISTQFTGASLTLLSKRSLSVPTLIMKSSILSTQIAQISNLNTLDISYCKTLTNENILSILEGVKVNSPQLTRLNLSGWPITDQTLKLFRYFSSFKNSLD